MQSLSGGMMTSQSLYRAHSSLSERPTRRSARSARAGPSVCDTDEMREMATDEENVETDFASDL